MAEVSKVAPAAQERSHAVIAALDRWGGLLVAPRATAARTGPDQGRHDGLILTVVYLLGTELYGVMEAVAGLVALKNLGALVMIGAQLGRALLAPILAVVVAETLLGPARAHRRAAVLLPLVFLGSVTHALRQQGLALPGPSWVPEAVGAALGVALVWWIRDAVPRSKEDAS